MTQVALFGLGQFNRDLLAELLSLQYADITVVDRDKEMVEQYKDQVANALIADVSKEQTVREIVSDRIGSVVIDLGERTGASILVVNYLKKIGVGWIAVKANTDRYARVLKSAGVNQVVLPGWDAARRIAPPLLLSSFRNYLPISDRLVMAEVNVPVWLVGETIITAHVRAKHEVNVIAMRSEAETEYAYADTLYRFEPTDIVLVTGSRLAINRFAGASFDDKSRRRESILKRVFSDNRSISLPKGILPKA